MRTQEHAKVDGIEGRETELASRELSSLSDNECDAVHGGLKWIDIHMPYNDFIRWKINDPSPTRLC